MEQLYALFDIKLRGVTLKFRRFIFDKIDWNNRLISIIGARGVGKTTLVLQYIKQQFKISSNLVLYADVNHLYFAERTLLELADDFHKKGGKYLFLDEIHKYPNWSVEIKQIYDTYYDLNVVITGSSILEILKGEADLSRRVVSYLMPGMSFREYLELDHGFVFEPFSLETILAEHRQIAQLITQEFRPLEFFDNYLKYGYYPYFIENKNAYSGKLLNTVNLILEVDMPAATSIDFQSINKLKKLLSVVSSSAPFIPNTNKLATLVEVSRPTLIRFFGLLEKAQLIGLLYSSAHGLKSLAKPEKIYLNNTNLMYTFARQIANEGTIRETFFLNQIKQLHDVTLAKKGDFEVDDKYVFEVGGKNKIFQQIAGLENSWIVSDDIETGFEHKIPLWLFGFLY
jgi:predicted AAA+ superfamily ATPase